MTVSRDAGLTAHDPRYALTLFVSGASGMSARAIYDVRLLCDRQFSGARLTVVDVHAEPEAALSSRVHVVPTLVRNSPLPVRRVVGDLSQTARVLSLLLLSHGEDAAEA